VNATTMAAVEPSLTYAPDAITDSTGQNNIAVRGPATVFSVAALSTSGTCYWIKDDLSTGTKYRFGDDATCSGTDAAVATATARS
jgi:hypothetical protein